MEVELSPIVLTGVRGSGEILMNGGNALHAKKGDEIDFLSYCK
jgi:aspartate 1-decarboxylase